MGPVDDGVVSSRDQSSIMVIRRHCGSFGQPVSLAARAGPRESGP